MKKSFLTLGLALLCMQPAFAENVSVIQTTGVGNLDVCEDSWGGFVLSCKKEKVQIPQKISIDSEFYIQFLEERRGYQVGFVAAKINYNPKKNNCMLQYGNSSWTATIYTKDCKVLMK